jgi:hypothetical protein
MTSALSNHFCLASFAALLSPAFAALTNSAAINKCALNKF